MGTYLRAVSILANVLLKSAVRQSRPHPHIEQLLPTTREGAQVTTPETIAYQNRELAKSLLALESHLSQGCRIFGKPCDCCSGRHPLELEKLSEEARSMSSDPVYAEVIAFAREVEMKANTQAVASGQYEGDYPGMAAHARRLRKRLVPQLESRATQLAALIRAGEITREEAVEELRQEV